MIGPFEGDYFWLSNFYVEPARGGYTNEHFFQAEKSYDPEERASVMNATTPGQAKRAGRKVTLREDWEDVKDSVMLSNLRNKFYIDPELRAKLLATGNETLAEVNTWGDRYWGVQEQSTPYGMELLGQNMLGILLMQVRAELRDVV